jgi:hypothetical protein
VKQSSVNVPATVGSRARRRGAEERNRIPSGTAYAAMSQRSRVVRRRPPVSSESSSATKKKIQTSTSRTAAVNGTGPSSCPSSGEAKKPKPVAVMSMPLRLSGRFRQAIRPKAQNDAPTRANTTASQSIGDSVSKRTGRSASTSATAASIQSAVSNARRGTRTAMRP